MALRILSAVIAIVLGAALPICAAVAQNNPRPRSGPVIEGQLIAEQLCAKCHATGVDGESPQVRAPPFRLLGERYPVEQLAEALAEGIVTGHAEMPEFTFTPEQIEAFLAYLVSLSPEKR